MLKKKMKEPVSNTHVLINFGRKSTDETCLESVEATEYRSAAVILEASF